MTIHASWTHGRILSHLASTSRSYLEVGVQEGRSLRVVLDAAPQMGRIVLCDDWGTRSGGTGRGSHDHIKQLLTEIGYHGEVTWLDGRSQEMLPQWLSSDPPGIDLVHVDGDHSEETCWLDMKHGWSVCRRAMVVHDVSFLGVHAAVFDFGKRVGVDRAYLSFDGHGTLVLTRDVTEDV